MTREEGLALLRKPFPENQVSLLPKPYKKDSQKADCEECGGYHGMPAIHLKYVGHAALTDRLLDVDPLWNWEPMTLADGLPGFDKIGGLWIKLTVCGITRLGYGHAENSQYKEIGSREKEVIGDALRNAAMRFGAALDLWHKGDLHIEGKHKQVSYGPSNTGIGPADERPFINPGDYVIKYGRKYQGKKLNEVPFEELWSYANYMMSEAEKTRKPLTQGFHEFYEALKKISPSNLTEEEIPF